MEEENEIEELLFQIKAKIEKGEITTEDLKKFLENPKMEMTEMNVLDWMSYGMKHRLCLIPPGHPL